MRGEKGERNVFLAFERMLFEQHGYESVQACVLLDLQFLAKKHLNNGEHHEN